MSSESPSFVQNEENFYCLRSTVTNDTRCTILDFHGERGIHEEEGVFYQKIWLKFKKETVDVLNLEHSFLWCWNLATSEIISEIPGKF